MYIHPTLLKKGKESFVGEFRNTRNRFSRIFADNTTSDEVSSLQKGKHKIQGEKQAIQDIARDTEIHEEKFDDVVKRSETVLFKAKSIFPFDFFPSDLIIDITKVTIVTRNFFLSGQTQSIYIKDILDIIVQTGPFFSSLTIIDMGYLPRNKIEVRYLKKSDAIQARQIIEGLLAATKAGVDLTKIPRRDLISRLPELRHSQITPSP